MSIAEILTASYSTGISGVMTVDSGHAGPVVAILACTHGNEPVGLAALDYLLSDLTLNCGVLHCILANPEGLARGQRYCDANMNRLPELLDAQDDAYEFCRAAELLPLLAGCDGVLDLHSTSSDAPPMLITADARGEELIRDPLFPFSHVVTEITPHLSGQFLIEKVPSGALRVLAECGQHQCLQASQNAIDISLAFLHAMGLADWPLAEAETPRAAPIIYRTKQAVFLPKNAGEFRLRHQIKPFEYVETGQPIACNGSEIVARCPANGYAIMCPETPDVLDCSEALLFLCDEV